MNGNAEDAMKDTQPAGATNTGTTAPPAAPAANKKAGSKPRSKSKSSKPRKAKKTAGSIPELQAAIRTAKPTDRIGLLKQLRGLQKVANAAALAKR